MNWFGFSHVGVSLSDSCWLRTFREHAIHLNDEYMSSGISKNHQIRILLLLWYKLYSLKVLSQQESLKLTPTCEKPNQFNSPVNSYTWLEMWSGNHVSSHQCKAHDNCLHKDTTRDWCLDSLIWWILHKSFKRRLVKHWPNF